MSPDQPSAFSRWMRDHLLSARAGLVTQDIDYFLLDTRGNVFLMAEEKNSLAAPVSPAQAVLFKLLDEFFRLQRVSDYAGSYLIYYPEDQPIRINSPDNPPVEPERLRVYLNQEGFSALRRLRSDWFTPVVQRWLPRLWDCRGKPTPGTRRERSGYRGNRLSAVPLRRGLLCGRVDWIFLNYCSGNFILLREINRSDGTYAPEVPDRYLTHRLNGLLEDATLLNQMKKQPARNPGSGAVYRYRGYFLLEFGGQSPADSRHIYLNHQPLNKDDLHRFLELADAGALRIAEQYKKNWWN